MDWLNAGTVGEDRRGGANRRGDRMASAMSWAWVVLIVLTGIGFALPLSRTLTDAISTGGFFGASGVGIVALIRALVLARGADRAGWLLLLASFGTSFVAAMVSRDANGNAPNAAEVVVALASFVLVGVVLLFGRRGVNRLDVTRLLVDALWLTLGLVTSTWHWAVAPLVELRGSELLGASFPAALALASVLTVLLLVRVAGADQVGFASIGAGCAIVSVASLIQMQELLAGEHQRGTWQDFLWVVGLSMLGYSTLNPDIGQGLRAHRSSSLSEQLVTCLPVLALLIPLLHGEAWADIPRLAAVAMVVVLAIRVITLISQNSDLSRRLTELAHRDELTGLLNRRALLEHLESLAGRMSSASRCTLLYLDLDGFKDVNDQWGHAAGDHVLAATAERLRTTVRTDDVVARLGGDEFVVAALDSDGAAFAKRLIPILAQSVLWEGRSLEIACSIGVATVPVDRMEDVLTEADAALYQAKANGRGRFAIGTSPQLADPDPSDNLAGQT